MPSERIQRQIDRLLDQADEAFASHAWGELRSHALDVLRLDAENQDAKTFLTAADEGLAEASPEVHRDVEEPGSSATTTPQPASFASGRYEVRRFLGEGCKKRVYLAHDAQLDRDVAFALIKAEGLDDAARQRITREAQAMGRFQVSAARAGHRACSIALRGTKVCHH